MYRHVGAGTPVAPPTKIGPAMVFNNVKGYDMPVVAGVLASRKRTALLLGSTPERLAFDLIEALEPSACGRWWCRASRLPARKW